MDYNMGIIVTYQKKPEVLAKKQQTITTLLKKVEKDQVWIACKMIGGYLNRKISIDDRIILRFYS